MKTHIELIKALEVCGQTMDCPKTCPYYNEETCQIHMHEDLIDFIRSAITLKEVAVEAYDDGMKKAWDMATKIAFIDKNGGFTCKEFNEIFGNKNKGEVFEMNPAEVAKMIEDWQETREYHVGSVVKYNDVLDMMDNHGEKGVIVNIESRQKKMATVLWSSREFGTYPLDELSLTGENVDILPMFNVLKTE